MALQGDLTSFALPDVLRLLAGTAKSGLLEVAGPGTSGELSLQRGALLRGGVSSAPRSESPSEVVFELLRLTEGSFTFAEGDQPGDGPTTEVEFALEQAEALLREWAEVESVVPGMGAWITLAAELDGDAVHLSAARWRTVAMVAGGARVVDLAEALGLSDLDACRSVKDLAEAGLVDVQPADLEEVPEAHDHGPDPEVAVAEEPYEAYESFDSYPSYETFEPLGGEEIVEPVGMTELEDLVIEDRPVVMEESEDALLPEPLPGEGVAYDGSDLTGVVDGRTPQADGPAPDHRIADTPIDDAAAAFAAFEGFEVAPVEELAHQGGGVDPFAPAEGVDESASATSADERSEFGGDDVDDERGSLLKFLSTVKP